MKLTLPKMRLVNGDRDNLSSIPSGMKIIGSAAAPGGEGSAACEVQRRLPAAECEPAGVCVCVCVAPGHFTLAEHINERIGWTARKNSSAGKLGVVVADVVTDGSGRLWQRSLARRAQNTRSRLSAWAQRWEATSLKPKHRGIFITGFGYTVIVCSKYTKNIKPSERPDGLLTRGPRRTV